MSFVDFIKKHTIASFSIAVGVVATAVSLINLASFNAKYDKEVEDYKKMQEEVNSKFAKAPESTFIDGSYISYNGDEVKSSKSNFKNSYVFGAKSAVINPLNKNKAGEIVKLDENENKLSECISGLDKMGGAINFNFTTDHYGYADIEISMRSSLLDAEKNLIGLTNITDYIKISMNRVEITTVNAELDDSTDFTSLILKNCFLLEGDNVVTLATSAYNPINTESKGSGDQGKTNSDILYVMPDIRNLTVLTDVKLVTE